MSEDDVITNEKEGTSFWKKKTEIIHMIKPNTHTVLSVYGPFDSNTLSPSPLYL